MTKSGIIKDAIHYKPSNKKSATHFALCNGGKIKYFISLYGGGKNRLAANLSSYSKKHRLLMKLINFLPFELLKLTKLGYFVEVNLCREIAGFIDKVAKIKFGSSNGDFDWNMIIGTYSGKQKLVVQCYGKQSAIYFKIGNQNSAKEMLAEIDFLEDNPQYNRFMVPRLISSRKMEDDFPFSILVTEEFTGEKVEVVMSDEIYRVFEEIVESRGIEIVNGVPFGFSHGDFAPWNLKIENTKYTLFDWEHCGMRFYGFDLIHYVYQIETLLNGKNKTEGLACAVAVAKKKNSVLNNIQDGIIAKLYTEECSNIF